MPPGTYSIGYSNSQHGLGVYSAPFSVSVGSGGTASVTAVYYTPIGLSAGFTTGVDTYTIYGYLTTSDNGAGLGGQTVWVYFSTNNQGSWYTWPTTASSNGYYSYTINDPYGGEGITNSKAIFNTNAGYLGSNSPIIG